MEDLEHTLYGALILERMVLTYQVCQLIVYLGAVLNGLNFTFIDVIFIP